MPDLRVAAVIAANNLRRVARAPIMLFTTLVLPFLIVGVVGVALAGNDSRLRAGVVSHQAAGSDPDLAAALGADTALDVTRYDDEAALQRAVRRGQVDAGIVVPADYATALLAGTVPTVRLVTTPDQTRAASVRTVLQSAVDQQTSSLQSATFAARASGRSQASELARIPQVAAQVSAPTVTTTDVGTASANALGFDYTAPSNLVLFIVITSLTSASTLIDSRVRGITTRLFALPVTRATVVLGELLGRFVIAAAQAVLILAVTAIAFGVTWGDPVGVALLTLAFCTFGAALGMLVGFGARSVSQAVAFGPPVGIVLGMLGGCMWPLTVVGPVVRSVGHITPHAWAMDGYLALMNRGADLAAVLPQVGVVSGFAAVVLAAAFVLVRHQEVR